MEIQARNVQHDIIAFFSVLSLANHCVVLSCWGSCVGQAIISRAVFCKNAKGQRKHYYQVTSTIKSERDSLVQLTFIVV